MSASSNSELLPSARSPTLAEALLDALVARGAKALFALPGDFVVPLLRELRRLDRLPIHTLAHEPAVGFAADGAARLGGGLGVACVTFGAGALNMVNAIANAWAEKIPLVVISGAPGLDERRGRLIHHQVKTLTTQLEVMRAVTLAQAVLDDPRTALAELDRVLDLARLHSRPVYLEVPRDLVTAICPAPTHTTRHFPPPTHASSLGVISDRADEAAHHTLASLAMAKAPLLLIDVELRRFGLEEKAALLANRLGLPILTTLSGRGLLAGTGLIGGTWLGRASEPEIAKSFAQADLILGLGLLHSDSNLVGHDLDPRVDRRVIDASDGLVRFPDRELPCTLGRFLDALLKQATWQARARMAPLTPQRSHHATTPGSGPPTPDELGLALAHFVSRHGPFPVVSDIGDCLFAALHLHDVEVLAPAYYATVGYGIPAALGAMAVTGRRPLVLIGDGAFQMTGLELASAVQLGLDPIVILFDNQGWDMVRAFDAEHPAHSLPQVQYELLADSLGCRGHLATDLSTFEAALLEAHTERGRPHLIRVPLAASSRSAGLTRFVHALSRANFADSLAKPGCPREKSQGD